MIHVRCVSFLASVAVLLAAAAVAAADPDADARATYERLFVGFDEQHYTAITLQGYGSIATGTAVPVTFGVPYRGVQHEWLDVPDFYDAVDRPDLTARVHRRHRIRVGGLVASGVALAASIYLVVDAAEVKADYGPCSALPEEQMAICQFQADRAATDGSADRALGATGLLAVSAIGLGVYLYLDENPVDDSERHRLANDHNAQLRRRLGLPDDVQVTPYAQPGGGGLAVSGRF